MAKTQTQWEVTSKDKNGATVVELKFKDIRVIVHRMHGDPDSWYYTCHDVREDKRALRADGLEAAKTEATQLVMSKLTAMMSQLHAFMLHPR